MCGVLQERELTDCEKDVNVEQLKAEVDGLRAEKGSLDSELRQLEYALSTS